MKQFHRIIIFLLILHFYNNAKGTDYLRDSIGIEKIKGVWFIIHKVDPNETVYALSRRYGVSSNDILQKNPKAKKGLSIGQKLEIPLNDYNPDQTTGTVTHIVKSSETLYSISRQHNVGVDDLKKWNNIQGNEISIGQKLLIKTKSIKPSVKHDPVDKTGGKIVHIVTSGESMFSISKKYNVSINDLRVWNNLDNNNVGIGQELIVGFSDQGGEGPIKVNYMIEEKDEESVKTPPVQTYDIPESNYEEEISDDGFKKITERGVASVIEGTETTKKYLALHRKAPIGTIMQIRNEMNDLTVFVRVIGKLPDTGENDRILIKISKTAYDRLRAVDDRFMVEINYHP